MDDTLLGAAAGLLLLLGARSKEVLARVLQDAFECRFQGWTRDRGRRIREELQLQDDAEVAVVRAARTPRLLLYRC
jgi:hypothetical protein